MSVDDYLRALEAELRDQPRRVRKAEAADLREHLAELPSGALDQLEPPNVYAHEYRAHRDLRGRRFASWLRRTPVVARTAIAALVVVVIAAASIPPWIAHYQPLDVNVFFGAFGVVPQRSDHGATVLSYRDGATITLGMSIRNSGRFDAAISGYDDGPLEGVLKFQAARVMVRSNCCLWKQGKPARFPFRVPAGSTLTLMLELRMTNCEFYGNAGGGGGDSVVYDQLRFPMKTLGVRHVVIAPLAGGRQIYVDMPGPSTRYCPRARSG